MYRLIFFLLAGYSLYGQTNQEIIYLFDKVGSNVLMKEYPKQELLEYSFLRANAIKNHLSTHEVFMFDLIPIKEISEEEFCKIRATSVYDLKSNEPFELHMWLTEKSPYIKLIVPFYYHIPSKPSGRKNRYYIYYASYRGTRFQ
ncbi:hypothetical protein BST92_06155 [Nonlabens arenilitoris]|uniref:Uncharacterized protein n=1 Tax=Nonlabens arenilitoris TaxID=1217969 RepID=A0A2S7UBA5_9FLAO|nr:hypothetical protein [Nonlabens arenilitoris]PQJ31532.1 hypothetical protein BST92_06155 [Nonlabens arenilitoris]